MAFERWLQIARSSFLQLEFLNRALLYSSERAAEAATALAKRDSLANWQSWLEDGPAQGLRRQHQLTRVATGWNPSLVSAGDNEIIDEYDDVVGLSERDLKSVLALPHFASMPLSAQAEVGVEAKRLSHEWQCDREYSPLHWPSDVGAELPEVTVCDLRNACATFPSATGLGWDGIHPRALLRLSDRTLGLLLQVLLLCELLGTWPTAVQLVIIVLLPKPEGGRRHIGLLPSPCRIWMRLRRTIAVQWQRDHPREYLYAGECRWG